MKTAIRCDGSRRLYVTHLSMDLIHLPLTSYVDTSRPDLSGDGCAAQRRWSECRQRAKQSTMKGGGHRRSEGGDLELGSGAGDEVEDIGDA
jgi:hypothetical protein